MRMQGWRGGRNLVNKSPSSFPDRKVGQPLRQQKTRVSKAKAGYLALAVHL